MQNRPVIYRCGTLESFYDMPLFTQFVITYNCNYKCSYCFQQPYVREHQSVNEQQFKVAIDHIRELNRPKNFIELVGGEVTTHPKFLKFAEYIFKTFGKRLTFFKITTNGSRSIEFFQKLADLVAKYNVTMIINFSIHTDHCSLDHILELAKKISPRIPILFSLMLNPAKMDFVKKIYEELTILRIQYPFDMNLNYVTVPPDFTEIDPRFTKNDLIWHDNARKYFEGVTKNFTSNIPTFRDIVTKHFTNFVVKQDISAIALQKNGKEIKTLIDCNRNEFMSAFETDEKFLARNECNTMKGMYCLYGTNFINIFPNGLCIGWVCGVCPIGTEKFSFNIFQSNPYDRMDEFLGMYKCCNDVCLCDFNDYNPKFLDKAEADGFLEIFKEKQKRLMEEYRNSR